MLHLLMNSQKANLACKCKVMIPRFQSIFPWLDGSCEDGSYMPLGFWALRPIVAIPRVALGQVVPLQILGPYPLPNSVMVLSQQNLNGVPMVTKPVKTANQQQHQRQHSSQVTEHYTQYLRSLKGTAPMLSLVSCH